MHAVHFCVVFIKTVFMYVKRWIKFRHFANSKFAKFESHQLFDFSKAKIEAESLYHVDPPVNPLSGYVGPPDPRQSTVATRAESTIRQFILQNNKKMIKYCACKQKRELVADKLFSSEVYGYP
mgnify:CR=1 FL=1